MNTLIKQIEEQFELDQKEKTKVYKASEIPTSYEAVTNAWLTAIICKKHSDAEVINFRLDVTDNGSTNRRRIYLNYNDAGQKAKLPSSVFCKASFDLGNRLLLALSGAAQAEVLFYEKIRSQVDFEAPQAWHAAINLESYASIIVLSDMADDVEFCDHKTTMTRERAESQVKLLAKLHSAFHESDQFNTLLKPLGTFEEYFARVQTAFNFDEFCNVGFLHAKAVIPASLYKRHEEIWPATLKSVAAHKSLPRTLIHSDVHLKNWYICNNGQGEMGLSDWQNICAGNWARDFSYTISTALTVENRRLWEKDLLKLYIDEVKQHCGSAIDFDTAWDLYRQQLLLALAWWTITLTPSPDMPDMQPTDTSMEFLKRITTAIDDLGTLEMFT